MAAQKTKKTIKNMVKKMFIIWLKLLLLNWPGHDLGGRETITILRPQVYQQTAQLIGTFADTDTNTITLEQKTLSAQFNQNIIN